LSFLDPDREQMEQYHLVFRSDHKLCPKKVQRCQQCRHAFTDSDKFVIKTPGVRELTDKFGKKQIFPGNIYLHFLTKCLIGYDNKFDYVMIVVPDGTKSKLHETRKAILRKKGIKV